MKKKDSLQKKIEEDSRERGKIVDSTWWSSFGEYCPVCNKGGQIGAIVLQTLQGYKCYMGSSRGSDDIKEDERRIAKNGAKVLPHIAEAMFDGKKFIY